MLLLLEKLPLYFQYPFVRHALAVSLLIALCAALLGVPLVLKRFSFLGDGLSHAAFGAVAAASVLGLGDSAPFVLTATLLCAVFLLRGGADAEIKGDAALAMLSVGSMAVGYILLNLFSAGPNISGDVCGSLFGSASLLTLTAGDVRLCAALCAAVLAAFLFFYHTFFAVAFDETFANASGLRASRYNLLLAALTAVIITAAMKLVGALLISALLVFPALTAMRLRKSYLGVTVSAAAVSLLCTLAGFFLSLLAGTPVGATIVMAQLSAFAAAALLRKISRKGGVHGNKSEK